MLKGSAGGSAEHGPGASVPNMKGSIAAIGNRKPGMQAMAGAPVNVPEYNQANGLPYLLRLPL